MADNLVDKPLEALEVAKVEEEDSSSEVAPTTAEANGAVPAPSQKQHNLYFVRVPRPHVDDAPVKELQTKLSATLPS